MSKNAPIVGTATAAVVAPLVLKSHTTSGRPGVTWNFDLADLATKAAADRQFAEGLAELVKSALGYRSSLGLGQLKDAKEFTWEEIAGLIRDSAQEEVSKAAIEAAEKEIAGAGFSWETTEAKLSLLDILVTERSAKGLALAKKALKAKFNL